MTKRVYKSTIFSTLVAFVLLIVAALSASFFNARTAYAATYDTSYTADFSDGLPSDWSIFSQSHTVDAVAPTATTNGLKVGHTGASLPAINNGNPGSAVYFGTMYKVAKSTPYMADFELNMTFRWTAAFNSSRWVGIMYHTQRNYQGNFGGYLMNFRLDGRSAFSVVNGFDSVTFNDQAKQTDFIADETNLPSTWYTMKIVMEGTTSKHYIKSSNQSDFTLIGTYNIAGETEKTQLGGVHYYGGFSLINAATTIEISSFTINGTAAKDNVSYEADLSNGLPTDWALNEKSMTSQATSSGNSGVLTLKHTGDALESQYYGAMYDVATGLGNLSDFVLEMTFRMPSADGDDAWRWFGVLYHAQENAEGMTESYMMNYRQFGASAESVITSEPVFNDGTRKETYADGATALPAIKDNYHTLTIMVIGDYAYHFIDDEPIMNYNMMDKASILNGCVLRNGGFKLIVNKSTLEITSLTISGTQKTQDYAKYQLYKGDLEFSPTVVTRVDGEQDIADIQTYRGADSAILTIDSSLNVLGKNGSLGTLASVLSSLGDAALPIVYVNDKASADALENYLTSTGLTDLAVMTKYYNILSEFRKTTAGSKVRGILDWSDNTLIEDKEDWLRVIQDTNKAYANVAVLSQEAATREAVEYIQTRLKTVWVLQEEYSVFGTTEIVSTGAYGIISDEPISVYEEVYEMYKDDTLPLVRAFQNVAHRGLLYTYAENSIAGYQAAVNAGATHIEVDVHMTADGHIVVMHDATIYRTTTYGSTAGASHAGGTIANMTLAQIQQYKIDAIYNKDYLRADEFILPESQWQPIPTLDDLFSTFKNQDVIYAFEIKSNEANFVQVLRQYVQRHDVWDQMFVITFKENIVAQMRDVMPEVPCAILGDYSEEWLAINNAAEDIGGAISNKATAETMKKRGYMPYFWTYDNQAAIDLGIQAGAFGITNNRADYVTDYAEYLEVKSNEYRHTSIADLQNNGLAMQVRLYNGSKVPVTATLHSYAEYGDCWKAIFKYTFTTETNLSYTLYSEPVYFVDEDKYMSVTELTALYNKDVSEFTQSDIATLQASKVAYSLLTEEDKALVNVGKADSLIAALEYKYTNFTVSITNDATKGTVSGIESTDYQRGTQKSVTVTALNGYNIKSVKVNGGNVYVESPLSVTFNLTVNAAMTIEVEYTQSFMATVSNDTSKGMVSGILSGTTYEDGETLYVSVVAKNGYLISSIKVNGVEKISSATPNYGLYVTVDGNVTFSVTYVRESSGESNSSSSRPSSSSSSSKTSATTGGCMGTVGGVGTMLAVLTTVGAALILKKKKEN